MTSSFSGCGGHTNISVSHVLCNVTLPLPSNLGGCITHFGVTECAKQPQIMRESNAVSSPLYHVSGAAV